MTRRYRASIRMLVLAGALVGTGTATAQIVSNAGDGVLNAPYRGTITSLRELSADIPYGEVKTHCEPLIGDTNLITSSTYSVWVLQENPDDQPWDRSVIRLFEGVDASGPELDLTGRGSGNPLSRTVPSEDFVRMSVKAIGTRTTEPLKFRIRFSYSINGTPTTATRIFVVAPITGSFSALPGESEMFHFGTPILSVSVGAAKLVVPVGRKAEMIGATFEDKDGRLGPSGMQAVDILFPGAAESVFIQNVAQFKLNNPVGSEPIYAKAAWGTPWPGHLVGFYNSGDTWGPDGTHYDHVEQVPPITDGLRRYDRIRPRDLSNNHPAAQQLVYDGSNRVTEIHDGASPNNVITLHRTAGVVDRITTSDGRGWDISADGNGWITSIDPDSGQGKRSYVHNSAGRVTQVKDASDQLMYEFVYANDLAGNPTVLTTELRFTPGQLTAVVHELVGTYQLRRKEFTATNEYRQYDLFYDDTNQLKHRLARVRAYRDLNGAVPAYDTVYTHDINNPAGTMVVTQVTLPDATTISYEYDHHPESGTVRFGFRSKATQAGASGPLITYDVDWDFFYVDGAVTRLYWRPRIIAERDGRHMRAPDNLNTEITYDYENGGQDENNDGLNGELSNQLLSQTGPTISAGGRMPATRYVYYNNADADPNIRRVLKRVETDFGSGMHRDITYEYDSLLRLKKQIMDPTGVSIITEYLYNDAAATQDRTIIDPDGFYTKTTYDNDGRPRFVLRFLTMGGTTGNFYQIENVYDANGRVFEVRVDNKDQNGNVITGAGQTNPIVTRHTYDRLGRLTLRAIDPSGINQRANFEYNWLGDIKREFDTSGRGVKRMFDGRGLVHEAFPFADPQNDEAYRLSLHTLFTYDVNGRLELTTSPTGARLRMVYDDFGRVRQQIRVPVPDGGVNIATLTEYDLASHVTRRTVRDNFTIGNPSSGVVLSDTTALFDEGGFNYESRQRISAAGMDSAGDLVMRRKFDWAGNVIEERVPGDNSPTDDRVVTTEYDSATRVHRVSDSAGGLTEYTIRDNRGNVKKTKVRLSHVPSDVFAETDAEFDALSRTTKIIDPQDQHAQRHYRVRTYNSRNNLLRETAFDVTPDPDLKIQTSVFEYDAAGRQTVSAALHDASMFTDPPSNSQDRVARTQYDADGRVIFRQRYNTGPGNQLVTITTATTYDAVGRVDVVTDPGGSTNDDYSQNGRLSSRTINDGVGTRVMTPSYDGHDRVMSQTESGTPALTTSYMYDGLDRVLTITDPRQIITKTVFDAAGRRVMLFENFGGPLQRETDFGYNLHGDLTTQTAKNRAANGGMPNDQVTKYRYDTMGRRVRIVYPDSIADPNDAMCVDCVKLAYDDAGRLRSLTDQRGWVTTYVHDPRDLLINRTVIAHNGSPPGMDAADSFDHDALGRVIHGDRELLQGISPVASFDRLYTNLGDVAYEDQSIAGGLMRHVGYMHDQAGNVTQLAYPSGAVTVNLTPTPLNQVGSLSFGARSVTYGFYGSNNVGRYMNTRRTATGVSNTTYEMKLNYDAHRRRSLVRNAVEPNGPQQEIVAHTLTHDDSGNTTGQTATGQARFAPDTRAFTIDELSRMVTWASQQTANGEVMTFDLQGNRESYTDRAEVTIGYGSVNGANEYASIINAAGTFPLTYDAAGNLSTDELGRTYLYDEQNRLSAIHGTSGELLASFTYDALGRRMTATFAQPEEGFATTRYYYDGRREIEERDGADSLVRAHVYGGQYIDERIATYTQATSQFTYYLHGDNFSVVGTGDAAGGQIQRLDYSASGNTVGCKLADGNCDGLVNNFDVDPFVAALTNPDSPTPPPGYNGTFQCWNQRYCWADVNGDGLLNNFDLDPFVGCLIAQGCGENLPPANGTPTLHGRPLDVISAQVGNPRDLVLLNGRPRSYDVRHGRWLQRDRGYRDGGNLYEAFRGNAGRFRDPHGRGVVDDILNFFHDYFGPDAQAARVFADAADNTPEALMTPRQIIGAQIGRVEAALGEAGRQAEPYVRPVLQGAGAVGGALQAGAGALIIYESGGLGAYVGGGALVTRGTDVFLTNVQGLFGGRSLPTAQWVLVSNLAGPEIASASEGATDLILLPLATVPFAGVGPAASFSSTATFAGAMRVPLVLVSQTGGIAPRLGLTDRLALGTQRVLQTITGEQEGFVLGMGVSPGALGPTELRTGRQLIFPFAEPSPPRIVFRVARADENPLVGFLARNPASTAGPTFAVTRGSSFATRFVFTTRDVNVALRNARLTGNRIFAIDLSVIPSSRVIDLSSEAARAAAGLRGPFAPYFSRSSAEVLIELEVPASSILDYVPLRVEP